MGVGCRCASGNGRGGGMGARNKGEAALETPVVASRVVAEIYRGIEFPPNWIDKPRVPNLGMTKKLLVSVAAMFDSNSRPLALCWRIDGREERFVHIGSQDPADNSLLDDLQRDLSEESRRLGGADDLLATMLWAPDDVRPGQGVPLRPISFGWRMGWGWNIPLRSMIAHADSLLFMTRCADDGLALPLPTTVAGMHRDFGATEPTTMLVMPGGVAAVADAHVNRKMAMLFGTIAVLGVLISAYLLHRQH